MVVVELAGCRRRLQEASVWGARVVVLVEVVAVVVVVTGVVLLLLGRCMQES